MYWSDHPPPHFHALYGDYGALVAIETGEIISGYLPRRTYKLVREWATLHRKELLINWQLAQEESPLNPLPPLE